MAFYLIHLMYGNSGTVAAIKMEFSLGPVVGDFMDRLEIRVLSRKDGLIQRVWYKMKKGSRLC